MLRMTQANLDAASGSAWQAYVGRLRRHLCARLPGFADMPTETQQARITAWTDEARGFGFVSERALAFWCHVAARLPDHWVETEAITEVLHDRGPNEPERLHRLKTRLEASEWAG